MKQIITCQRCGDALKTPPSQAGGLKSGLCKNCSYAERSKDWVKLVCSNCGATRLTAPSIAKLHKSDLCGVCSRAAQRRVYHTVVCPTCGAVRHHGSIPNLKSDLCKSCSTVARNRARAKHNLESHPLYATGENIKRRLENPTGKSRTYTGLDMDPEWRDVRNFVTWAVAAGWQPGLSIERLDNSKGYWPGNCVFIPIKHQARNKQNSSITPAIAELIKSRVAAGEVRYHVAKDVAASHNIPLSTVVKVAYGYNWV